MFSRTRVNSFFCTEVWGFFLYDDRLSFVDPFSLQTKLDTCANRVDPDEMASNQPSYHDLHCLLF